MQFALGSVLKPIRSAFGGLGSFRAPSIRRALPVLLGGLLCVVGSAAMAQVINRAEFRANANDVFKIGDTLWVDVTYSSTVETLVGSPSLKIRIGATTSASSTKTAACALQTNRTTLQCGYTVAEGDEGSATNTLSIVDEDLVGGSGLPDTDLTGHIQLPPTGVEVDGVRIGVEALTVQGQTLTTQRTAYKAGDTITIRVAFDETTTTAGVGSFGVTLVLDGEDRVMTRTNVVTPSGENTHAEFAYVVAATDNASRVRVTYTNTANLKDDAGNAGLKAGALTLARAVEGAATAIDNQAPTMVSVRGPDSGEMVRNSDHTVGLVVRFSEEVIVTGTGAPILGVTVGSDTGAANCSNPSTPVRELTCDLPISDGWSAPNGISIPRNPIRLVAVTIKDRNDHALNFAFAGTRLPNQKVDAVAPWIKTVTLTVPSNAGLKVNSLVKVDITFSEEVKLATGATRPVPPFSINGIPTLLSYVGGSGTKWQYRFALTELTAGSEITFAIVEPEMHLLSANVEDVAGNDLDTQIDTRLPITIQRTIPAVITDTSRPTVQGVRVSSVKSSDTALDRKVLKTGERIEFAVLFSEPVRVVGIELGLRVGSVNRKGVLGVAIEGSGNFEWGFQYTVVAEDSGAISVGDLEFGNTGSLKDVASTGNGYVKTARPSQNAMAGLQYGTSTLSVGSVSGYSVDNTPPRVVKAELLRTPAPGAVSESDGNRYYGKGDFIRAVLTISERVTVAGMAELENVKLLTNIAMDGGCATMDLKLISSDGRRLTFECQVGDEQQPSGLGLNGLTGTDLLDPAATKLPEVANSGETLLPRQSTHLVDGMLTGEQEGVAPITDDPQTPQTVSPVGSALVRSTTPVGGYYKSGDTIRIEVPLNPAVTFTSAPQLLLDFDEGGSRRITAEGSFSSSGTARTNLVFNYPVTSGDEDVDGFTGTLSGGGTVSVADGRGVTLGSITISSAVKIDARVPQVDSIAITSSAGADGTYVIGENIDVTVRFSEDVRRQGTTDPRLPIVVGNVARTALLQSPAATAAATDTWLFRYVVLAGDNDADGVAIAANALVAALEDAVGNAVIVTHAAVAASTAHRVDTQGPSVTGVAIGGDDSGLFREGSTITATVRFDEEVDVATSGANAVNVRFFVGSMERTAAYASGDGTTALTFTYEVAAGDSGPLSVPANAIVGDVEDAAGNAARGNIAIPVTAYRVDAAAPMLVGISISSRPASGDAYTEGETIGLQVSFDEPVVVDGAPRLPMVVGSRTRNRVLYTGGSGTPVLTFSYVVLAGDMDDNGVSVPANSLRLTSGATIKDVTGLSVASESGTVAHGALPDQPGHKVDAVAPDIESLAITSRPNSGDAYLIDEVIEVTVRFSESVSVSGSPMLGLMVGTGSRNASCAQGSDMAAIVCSYAVVANDFDEDGVSVNADALSGAITDVPGNAAILAHPGLDDDPDHKVHAARPEVAESIPNLTLMAGGAGDTLDLTRIFRGFQLSYSAMSSDTSVAAASVSGTTLTVRSGAEGTATVTVTATNLAGLAETAFSVTVRTDPVETTVLNDALAAMGRSMLSSTANVIGARFNLVATSAQMALGGNRFGGSLSPRMQRLFSGNDPFAMRERMGERALFSGGAGSAGHAGGHGVTADRLLTGTSFNMPLNAVGMGDAQFAIWGAGDLQSFEGEPDNGMYDGSASAGFIGVDARGAGWLAGVSISRSGAEADYDFDGVVQGGGTGGTLETAVTAFHPYARLEVGSDSEIWVIGGFGGGEADLSRRHVADGQTRSSDLAMAMAVGGLRRALAMEFGGADLSLRGDAGFLSLETDSGMNAVDGLSASVSRLRLGLEAAWKLGSVSPFVEVSGRFDGGDGQTGGGLELAGGLRLLGLVSGFGLEAKGRILAVHTGDGYGESGISVTASFEPGTMGRGIAFRLSPRWGGSADATDLFWDEVGSVREASRHGYGFDRRQTWGVDAALGYGFSLRSMPGIVTPFSQVDMTGDQDQRIRIGVRYGLMQGLLGGTQVELSAERVDGEMHRVGETRVLVSGRARF